MQSRKTCPKSFYAYINSAKKSRSKIGPLRKDGEVITDPKDQAEILNGQYASVFTRTMNKYILMMNRLPKRKCEMQLTN